MKKIIVVSAVTSVLALTSIHTVLAGTVKNRQIRQQDRIHQGIRSGELNRCETRRLEMQQARIQNAKIRAWQDGTMTVKESVKLDTMQDQASRNICRAKHNNK